MATMIRDLIDTLWNIAGTTKPHKDTVDFVLKKNDEKFTLLLESLTI
jgi:hypothetical protein